METDMPVIYEPTGRALEYSHVGSNEPNKASMKYINLFSSIEAAIVK